MHHLDGNPSNNVFDNLALLCLTHHHEATVQSGIARKLSSETIRRYRKAHYERIERTRRVQRIARPRTQAEEKFEAFVQAVEVSEIRKLRAHFAFCDPVEAEPFVMKLYDYWQCGDQTKLAILEALYEIAANAKWGLPHKLSFQIRNIAVNTLPLWNTWWQPKGRLPKIENAMYQIVVQIGFEMAYRGARDLNDLLIVKDGADLLWQSLRVGWKFRCKSLVELARREFDHVIDASGGEAKRLLITFRDQATQKEIGYPQLDDDLEQIVYELEVKTKYPS